WVKERTTIPILSDVSLITGNCFVESCGGSVLSSPFLKGFLAGYVVAKLRSSAILGVLVGTCTGIYAAQSYQVPNVEQSIKNYFSSFKKR
uniref:Si:ch73-42p12.2 n=1 Tax=Sinocyclocheilus anshuiensis TaxID=1608454 RepID=A0A671K6H1_9TELE